MTTHRSPNYSIEISHVILTTNPISMTYVFIDRRPILNKLSFLAFSMKLLTSDSTLRLIKNTTIAVKTAMAKPLSVL
jgi:hypothetical protein